MNAFETLQAGQTGRVAQVESYPFSGPHVEVHRALLSPTYGTIAGLIDSGKAILIEQVRVLFSEEGFTTAERFIDYVTSGRFYKTFGVQVTMQLYNHTNPIEPYDPNTTEARGTVGVVFYDWSRRNDQEMQDEITRVKEQSFGKGISPKAAKTIRTYHPEI